MQGPWTLSASVTVAEDIPVLRAFEAAASDCGERTELRAYRLDTVEDDETMISSLPLPTSPGGAFLDRILTRLVYCLGGGALQMRELSAAVPLKHKFFAVEKMDCDSHLLSLSLRAGSALPPRHLQVHDLMQADLLGHPTAVAAVLPSERVNSVATLSDDGRVLLWRLSPLKPLQSLTLPRC